MGQGLTKTKCNFACTYPFMENLGTKLCLFDEINRLAGSRSDVSTPQAPSQLLDYFLKIILDYYMSSPAKLGQDIQVFLLFHKKIAPSL